jgi:hypothetical protein
MDQAESIKHDGRVLAIVIRSDAVIDGTKFFTPESYPFQLGMMVHEAGSSIRPHVHKPIERMITGTQEMIRIDYGKAEVDFYDEKGSKLKSIILEKGDTILFVAGGHGFRFHEKTKMTELKQGPYSGVDNDKEAFNV